MATAKTIRVLGIETSCDETAAAVVAVAASCKLQAASCGRFSFDVLSNVIASQVDIHARYGGIVPEVAAREHVGAILPVIEAALRDAHLSPLNPPSPQSGEGGGRKEVGLHGEHGEGGGKKKAALVGAASGKSQATSKGRDKKNVRPAAVSLQLAACVDAIAVTAGPGLMTSLAVGVETARTIAYAWGLPVIGVSHIEGHVLSPLLPLPCVGAVDAEIAFPALALIVSGGHTELLRIARWGRYELLGATRDDAVGEAFDKVAKLLGLGYPGGPIVAKVAEAGDSAAFDFPRPMCDSNDFDFSFSGLKTAVRYALARVASRAMSDEVRADVCASFQQAAVDVLVAKTIRAARAVRAKTVLLGGGVAANGELRRQLRDAVRNELVACRLQLAAPQYTGDNAAMIAAAGGVRLCLGKETGWSKIAVDGNWELGR